MTTTPTPNARKAYDFGFKRITAYSDEELTMAVNMAKDECTQCNLDFYAILRGIDAYMEKRRRKDATRPGSNTPLSKV
jgi:hypothetical protein